MKKYYTEQTDRAAAIIVIRESYERTASGRGWRSVPYETEIRQAYPGVEFKEL